MKGATPVGDALVVAGLLISIHAPMKGATVQLFRFFR